VNGDLVCRARERPAAHSVRISAGKIFVVGEQWDSLDSRDAEFGLVDVQQVVGEPLLIIWSSDWDRIGGRVR
jgi:hypothetical protein